MKHGFSFTNACLVIPLYNVENSVIIMELNMWKLVEMYVNGMTKPCYKVENLKPMPYDLKI